MNFKKGDKVRFWPQDTNGIVEEVFTNGNIYVRWDDYIVHSDGMKAVASEIDPKIIKLEKIKGE